MINIPVRLLIALASLPLASGCDRLLAEVARLHGNEVVMCPGSEKAAPRRPRPEAGAEGSF